MAFNDNADVYLPNSLQEPMPYQRSLIVDMAFRKLDREKDGFLNAKKLLK
jgi:hypothetical protein